MTTQSHPPRVVLGIDLGTTNSTASQARNDAGDVVVTTLNIEQETQQGPYINTLVPSSVAIVGEQLFVGDGAKRLRGSQQTVPLVNLFSDCKNDIGIKRTYHKAQPGFRSAAEIGGKVLQFLHSAARADLNRDFDRVAVTVPASFDANQRADTLLAAQLAGIELSDGDLLDEPIAAFIDYLAFKPELADGLGGAPQTLMVFDFGGGTCDIAVFRLEPSKKQTGWEIATLAVSRYHRLGGGDIDAAILHDVLVPQLLNENSLSQFDLDYYEKTRAIEPALIGVAEALKIKICNEIRKLSAFGKYDPASAEEIVVKQPGVFNAAVGGKTLTLSSPTLSAAQFEHALSPFLDRELLYTRETEYRLTCSIFAPLQDALDRAGFTPRAIDLCLMVGGSSLIPQVSEALDIFMPNARILTFPDRERVKTCVSRGAALHALRSAVDGVSLIAAVCHDDIQILTAEGAVNIVPRGAVLPHPSATGVASYDRLQMPKAIARDEVFKLRIELVAGKEQRRFFAESWEIRGPVEKGSRLKLDYRYDANQVLQLQLTLADRHGTQSFKAEKEKPLTSVINPNSFREAALALEEEIKTAALSQNETMRKMIELASLYSSLDHHDRAISLLRAVLQKKQQPDAQLVNRIATLHGEKGDVKRQEKYYREAMKVSGQWHGPAFNLALLLRDLGRLAEAASVLDQSLALHRGGAYLILRGSIAAQMHDLPLRNSLYTEALSKMQPISTLNDWELGWFAFAAAALDDDAAESLATDEIKSRAAAGEAVAEVAGELPAQAQAARKDR